MYAYYCQYMYVYGMMKKKGNIKIAEILDNSMEY